jgi:hypothetical protein
MVVWHVTGGGEVGWRVMFTIKIGRKPWLGVPMDPEKVGQEGFFEVFLNKYLNTITYLVPQICLRHPTVACLGRIARLEATPGTASCTGVL